MEAHPDFEIQVYTVWLDMLSTDNRSEVDLTLMPDPRVTQFWDGERALGTWFSEQAEYESVTFGPVAWDTYFLYGPEVDWSDTPPTYIASGRTIISSRRGLMKKLQPMIAK